MCVLSLCPAVLFCECRPDTLKVQCAWDMRPKNKGQTPSALVMGLEAGRMVVVPHADCEGKLWKEEDGEKPEEPILPFLGLYNPKVS